jgi:lipopolysaccharide/colanic/teichoic acid biosynthesis glycosyltransferase
MKIYPSIKRCADIVASVGVGAVTLPPCLIIAVIIRVQDGGSVLYTQTRLGKDGVPFTLYKFRTMRMDAEANGPQWALYNDTRSTRVGRFLRHWYLDELPQVWNVLKGDMTWVGPRPERPEMYDMLAGHIPAFRTRLSVRPGITGLAQASMQSPASIEASREKLAYDLTYIEHQSLSLDLGILFMTIGRFL